MACAFQEQGLGAACTFAGQVATFVLAEAGIQFGCMLKNSLCCSPYTQGEWYLIDSTQLGAELFPLILGATAFPLDLNLLQVQVIIQGMTFAVPLVSFLIDWPVGTVFVYADHHTVHTPFMQLADLKVPYMLISALTSVIFHIGRIARSGTGQFCSSGPKSAGHG